MNDFGWDYPPGCTDRHIEEAFNSNSECEDCDEELTDGEAKTCHTCGYVVCQQCLEEEHGKGVCDG